MVRVCYCLTRIVLISSQQRMLSDCYHLEYSPAISFLRCLTYLSNPLLYPPLLTTILSCTLSLFTIYHHYTIPHHALGGLLV